MLQKENIRSARCLRVVLSKMLAARKIIFLSLLELAKNRTARMLSNARKDHSSPLIFCRNVVFNIENSFIIKPHLQLYNIMLLYQN